MNTELLAPVGSFDALKAAVQNGANAVYLGGKEFSARASANNFDRDELKEAVRYAHIRGVQVFVTANTLRKQNEIEEFLEYIKYLYDIDVDAIILQDIGMARLVKELLPDFEIHASTQMVAHSLEDVLYLQNIGFDRVVLARELNIQEIEHICKNSNVDIEVFVHGALCVCYSGQCLMSSMLGNRSGNRGRCAQPCRQKYELIDIYSGEVINTDGEYLLSPKDLNSIQDIDKVIEAGVHSLKIEGRMKRPEYVATVIGSYRKTIDEYMETKKINVSDETMNNLYTIFNRKFTKGYLFGDVGEDIMNSNRPNNLGLYIGKVVDYNRKAKRLKIKLENTLKKGDGISIGGGTIGRIIKSNGDIANIGYKGETIELDFMIDGILDYDQNLIECLSLYNDKVIKTGFVVKGDTFKYYASGKELVSLNLVEGKRIKLSFVIEPKSIQYPLCYTYLDGIISNVTNYDLTHDFVNNPENPGYLKINSIGGQVYIYNIRFYSSNLDASTILNNYQATLDSLEDRQANYEENLIRDLLGDINLEKIESEDYNL